MKQLTIDNVIEEVKSYNSGKDLNMIKEAYLFSKKAHSNQFRESGEPFVNHPLEVAKLLTEIKLDVNSIASGLLHDTIEDTDVKIEEIDSSFGSEVSSLVSGLTKINAIAEKNYQLRSSVNFRKLLLATSKDIRVILIKLADRLHNMQTLEYKKDNEKSLIIALETQEIYAPLAQRLGIRDWQEQLEDLSFKKTNPEARNSILDRLNYLNKKDENIIDQIIFEIKSKLKNEGVNCDIRGRLKTPYSIWIKIKRKSISFEQLADIMAFRVITNSSRDCYKALGVIHRNYSYIQGRFKDFVSSPKSNGYRSIHTTIIGPKNKKIEIQFRSKVMDQIAEFGVAAHWKYKDPTSIKEKESKENKWLYDLIELSEQSTTKEEILKNAKTNFFQDHIYVFSPKGDIIELPKNATSIDFAYSIHTEIGDKCVAAKINGKLQPLKTILKNGDQIEVLTSNQAKPSLLWERIAVTNKVKTQLRKFVRSKKRNEYILLGKEILTNIFLKEEIEITKEIISKILKEYHTANIDNVYELIGSGSLTVSAVIKKLFPEMRINKKNNKNQKLKKPSIKLKGLTQGMSYHLAGCCSPIIGDKIVAIVTAGVGVSIHTIDCDVLDSYSDSPERWLEVSWDNEKDKAIINVSRINIVLINETGSLGKVTSVIGKNNGNISNIRFINRKKDLFEILIDIEVRDNLHLMNIIAALRLLSEVSNVERTKG